jgi:shikimate dehydrogenase
MQTTSCGMTGAAPGEIVANAVDWSALPAYAVALDVVYAPSETPFLRAARARGLRAANGLGMLARQGALAFELWLGIPAPYDVMLAAIS